MLGIGNGYARYCQMRSVDERKDNGGVRTEGGCNKLAPCMGGKIMAL